MAAYETIMIVPSRFRKDTSPFPVHIVIQKPGQSKIETGLASRETGRKSARVILRSASFHIAAITRRTVTHAEDRE